MQTLSSPIPQRIAHYKSEADRLRRMAEAEPIEAVRNELLAVARQYQQLADCLKTGAPFTAEVWLRSSLGVWRYKERILTQLRGHYVRRSSRSSASATSSFSTAAVSGDLALRKPSRSRRRKKRNQASSGSRSFMRRRLHLGGTIPREDQRTMMDVKAARCRLPPTCQDQSSCNGRSQAAWNSRALLSAGSRYYRPTSNRGAAEARRRVRATGGRIASRRRDVAEPHQ